MLNTKDFAVKKLVAMAPRFLPFADVATDELPLRRLLRLALFQITVGMALVLLVGTLNRVMIVELDVPASIVGIMLALPLLFAPFRTLIGFKSDTYDSALGWRRTPYIFKGTMLQFGGFAIMPFALLVLSQQGYAADAPRWLGLGSAAIAFLLVGAGVHIVQTVGLALATDLVREEDQPNVVGLMYVMLLVGMIGAAFVYGRLLDPYSPGALIAAIQGSAVVTIVLNGVAMWKQEPRNRARAASDRVKPEFSEAWRGFVGQTNALRLLVVIGLGTFGYGMADVLLEPYGGQVLNMSVAATTKLTAVLAGGSLIGFWMASFLLARGGSPTRMAWTGALIGVPAFAAIIVAATGGGVGLFTFGVLFAGFGAGLFGHGTLTATMRAAPADQVGLALGAWGAVQATCAGLAVAFGGVIRDLVVAGGAQAAQAPYVPVFALEMGFLVFAVIAIWPLRRKITGISQQEAYVS
ncbi:MAG: PucC family protein [Paracoccaceae bacterium]